MLWPTAIILEITEVIYGCRQQQQQKLKSLVSGKPHYLRCYNGPNLWHSSLGPSPRHGHWDSTTTSWEDDDNKEMLTGASQLELIPVNSVALHLKELVVCQSRVDSAQPIIMFSYVSNLSMGPTFDDYLL